MMHGKGVVKSIDQFDAHKDDEPAFMKLLEECRSAGVERPSSYSDVFHQRFYSPRVPYTVNCMFKNHFAGAWQEAKQVGVTSGPLYKYDMNTAYLWSGSQGLPNPATFRFTDKVEDSAMFLARIDPNVDAPFPFNKEKVVICEREDVELYNLKVRRVFAGVKWSQSIDGDEILRVVDRFSFGKKIGQAYWGRWASNTPIQCTTLKGGEIRRRWELGNPMLNFVWAQIIINRVKRRLYEYEPCPLHVFVDSMITRHQIATSSERGGWKLVKEYPNGIHITAPGVYGEPGCKLEKQAGVRRAA